MVKPRYTNKVQSLFAGSLRKALADCFGVTDAICPVLMTGQPIPQTAARCVTYSKLNSKRVGFQGKKYLTDDSVLTGYDTIENWIDEITFQVNARCKETVSGDENTPVAKDIADGIITWFNSVVGSDYMRSIDVYPLRVTDSRTIVNSDESDLFQNLATFDITVQVGQAKEFATDAEFGILKDVVGVPGMVGKSDI